MPQVQSPRRKAKLSIFSLRHLSLFCVPAKRRLTYCLAPTQDRFRCPHNIASRSHSLGGSPPQIPRDQLAARTSRAQAWRSACASIPLMLLATTRDLGGSSPEHSRWSPSWLMSTLNQVRIPFELTLRADYLAIFSIEVWFTTPKSAQALCKDSTTFGEPTRVMSTLTARRAAADRQKLTT